MIGDGRESTAFSHDWLQVRLCEVTATYHGHHVVLCVISTRSSRCAQNLNAYNSFGIDKVPYVELATRLENSQTIYRLEDE